MTKVKPMLANSDYRTEQDLCKLRFPMFVSPKIDGIRCILADMGMSRTFIPIPNLFVQRKLREIRDVVDQNGCGPTLLDGELVIVNNTINDVGYDDVQSGIMSRDGEPKFEYHLFDSVVPDKPEHPYHSRLERVEVIHSLLVQRGINLCKVVPQTIVKTVGDIALVEDEVLKQGYEGLIIRSMDGKYKYGRSTANEQLLVKFVRRERIEGKVVGVVELQRNTNDDIKNAFGDAKRSRVKDGMVAGDTMGALEVEIEHSGEFENHFSTVEVGTGFTSKQRDEIWKRFKDGGVIGDIVTIEHRGVTKDFSLRFPSFKGFRKD